MFSPHPGSHDPMAGANNRTPEETLRLGRRVCAIGQAVVVALSIAIIAVIPSVTAVALTLGFDVLYTIYNALLWRSVKKQADSQADGSSLI